MNRRGFTVIELLVVIVMIGVLAAILFPVFAAAREKARQSSCQSNLKEIATALMMYGNDYGGFPPAGREKAGLRPPWRALLEYIKYTATFDCPSDSRQRPLDPDEKFISDLIARPSYGIRAESLGRKFAGEATDGSYAPYPIILDTTKPDGLWNNNPKGPDWLFRPEEVEGTTAIPALGRLHQGENVNVAFLDGHVKALKVGTLAAAMKPPEGIYSQPLPKPPPQSAPAEQPAVTKQPTATTLPDGEYDFTGRVSVKDGALSVSGKLTPKKE